MRCQLNRFPVRQVIPGGLNSDVKKQKERRITSPTLSKDDMKELVKKLLQAEPRKYEQHHKNSLIALTYLEKQNPPEDELKVFRVNIIGKRETIILYCPKPIYAGQLYTKGTQQLKSYGHASYFDIKKCFEKCGVDVEKRCLKVLGDENINDLITDTYVAMSQELAEKVSRIRKIGRGK